LRSKNAGKGRRRHEWFRCATARHLSDLVHFRNRGCRTLKLRAHIAFVFLLTAINCLTATSALAQTRGEVTVRYTMISPFVALLAGILILIVPRLLNYIVAIYLILIGLIGIFGR
jgi:hypothetical protein